MEKQKTTKANKDKSKENTNWKDVIIRIIDALYDLAQTGNIIGLILLAFIIWIFSITYKVSPEYIEKSLDGFGAFLREEKFYFIPMGLALVFSLITNAYQAVIYKAHIKELTEHRKLLVHGLESGELNHLTVHRTSTQSKKQTGDT